MLVAAAVTLFFSLQQDPAQAVRQELEFQHKALLRELERAGKLDPSVEEALSRSHRETVEQILKILSKGAPEGVIPPKPAAEPRPVTAIKLPSRDELTKLQSKIEDRLARVNLEQEAARSQVGELESDKKFFSGNWNDWDEAELQNARRRLARLEREEEDLQCELRSMRRRIQDLEILRAYADQIQVTRIEEVRDRATICYEQKNYREAALGFKLSFYASDGSARAEAAFMSAVVSIEAGQVDDAEAWVEEYVRTGQKCACHPDVRAHLQASAALAPVLNRPRLRRLLGGGR